MKYLPIDQGLNSRWDVYAPGVRVTYDHDCQHRNAASYQMMDRRSEGMDKFYGMACPDCGFILTKHELK